ncbi:hypothetical protein KSD_43850 [Ktedonobacter sp. SOSP1-85]|nr:hypothetical protein KSD_43850 [Ktedonobacter sp. SOSP1-85]
MILSIKSALAETGQVQACLRKPLPLGMGFLTVVVTVVGAGFVSVGGTGVSVGREGKFQPSLGGVGIGVAT